MTFQGAGEGIYLYPESRTVESIRIGQLPSAVCAALRYQLIAEATYLRFAPVLLFRNKSLQTFLNRIRRALTPL